MSLNESLNEPVAAQLARLQQTKESLNQCIQIVSEAGELANERSNVFEELDLADNSYEFSVSTVGDLVTARRLKMSGRSRHFGGQVADETVQKAIQALTQLDAEYYKYSNNEQGPRQTSSIFPSQAKDKHTTRQFNDRFGPGTVLAAKTQNS
jgi:hypothetical protein